jgi:flagellar biosynthetic protein FlhB
MPHEFYKLILRLLFGVLAVVTVLALFDYAYQRFAFMRSMRMSKQEVKEENKQAEGDPVIRARLRAIRMNRARKRMMAAVPKASVVITNPTHYAVALQYDMGDSGAPKVVAKGADLVAMKIREIAAEHDVPIVENPPLARALYAGVEIDREIPPEHYKAVAEIISYVFRLKGKLRPQPSAAR